MINDTGYARSWASKGLRPKSLDLQPCQGPSPNGVDIHSGLPESGPPESGPLRVRAPRASQSLDPQ
eukprot:2524413-Pyramimonas_sp.AAC.1